MSVNPTDPDTLPPDLPIVPPDNALLPDPTSPAEPLTAPPLTSPIGWGFDEPDAGVGVAPETVQPAQVDSSLPGPHAPDPMAQPLPAHEDAGYVKPDM